MKKILFILIILLLMTGVLAGLAIVLKGWPKSKTAVDYRPQAVTIEPSEQKERTVLIVTEIIPATGAGAPAYVKLAVKPGGSNLTLLAFDLRLLIKAVKGSVKTGGAMTVDKNLAKLDWSFPIKRIETEGEQLVVEISGLHVAPQAFDLQGEQILAAIPIIVPAGEKITVELDNKITQFLDGKSLKLITAHEQK